MAIWESRTSDGTACCLHAQNGKRGGASGLPVLLIHGLGLNQHMWAAQIDALALHGPVVTYDLYGHGETPPPPEKPCLRLFADQAISVAAHFGFESVVVAGFSLGGMIARRIAMDAPGKVAGLAVLHSAHARTKTEHEAIQKRVYQAAKEGPGATVDAAIERWFTAEFRASTPQIIDQVRQWVMANDRNIYPPIYQVLVDGVDELVAPMPPIAAPTLVMTGDEDYGNHPGMSAAISDEIKGSVLVVLEGLRHMAMMENPEKFNYHLVNFISAVAEDERKTENG